MARDNTRSATYLGDAIAASGLTHRDIADHLGIHPVAVQLWTDGTNRPAIERLPALAELLDVPLAELCDTLGKPPVEALRAAFADDPTGSLPGLLRAWRDQQGLTSRAAAAIVGVRQEDFSRMLAGSRQPGRSTLLRIVDVLPFTLVELTDAAWPGDDETSVARRRWARCHSRPTATLIRQSRARLGTSDAAVEAATGIGASVMDDLTGGVRVPDIDQCVALARGLGLDLMGLLLAAGVDVTTASEVTAAIAATARRRKHSGRELVARLRRRPYVDTRGQRRTAIAWDELARRTGMDRFRIMKVVTGTHAAGFTVLECMSLADALDTPRERLLAGFGHHV